MISTVEELRAEAQKMLRDGTMPSLEDVLVAVNDSREKFSPLILKARSKNLPGLAALGRK